MNLEGNIVKFTPSAVAQIKRLIANEPENTNTYLRLGAKNGGCAGYSYIFEFDTKKETDRVEHFQDFSIIIDPEHASLIANLEINYESGLNNRGFIFKNPNAKTTCGCGTSFS